MSRSEMESLINRFATDPAFAQALRKDPRHAPHDYGFDLDQREIAALASMDWTQHAGDDAGYADEARRVHLNPFYSPAW